MIRLRAVVAVLAFAGALAVAAPAGAYDVSAAELDSQLSAVESGQEPASDLSGITSVDGRPADFSRVLAVGGEEQAARVRELGRVGDVGTVEDAARLSNRAAELQGDPDRTR